MTTPAGWYPDPDGSGGQRYWYGSAWTEHRSPATDAPAASAPPPAPSGEPPASDPRRKLIIGFGAACATLLAVLVLVVIYGLFIHKDSGLQISTAPASTSKSATPSTSAGSGWGTGPGTGTASQSPTAASGSGPQASDAGMTFALTGVETAPSVKNQDAPVEKTAQGEFFIAHLTVLNSGGAPAAFVGTLQKLNAGGTVYGIDDEATAYLKGTYADINPGETAEVAIAFDVPPGTSPESLEVHGEPLGAGVDIPLS